MANPKVAHKPKPKPEAKHPVKKLLDNSDMEAKKKVRDWCIQQVSGSAANCTVLELYGGLGKIHDACYTNPPVKKHMAFELRNVDRPTWIAGDNRVLLPKYVQGWDLYDLDAYANPWVLAMNVAKLRGPGRFSMALTCGMHRPLMAGTIPPHLRQACGYNGLPQNHLVALFYNDIIRSCMNDWLRFGVKVEKAVRIHALPPNKTYYYGVIVNKSDE